MPLLCYGYGTGTGIGTESTGTLLDRLTSELLKSDEYAALKEARIASMRGVTYTPHISERQIYDIHMSIIDEYQVYQFDSTLNYLYWNLGIARDLKDDFRIGQTLIQLGKIHATAGYYFEASSFLSKQLDTVNLDDRLLIPYYDAQHRLNYEMELYAKNDEIANLWHKTAVYYRDRLFELLEPDSYQYRMLKVEELLQQGENQKAATLATTILEASAPDSREASASAYQLSQIYERMGNIQMQKHFLIISALADIRSAVRDNASICALALILFNEGEINLAFQFSRTAMNDAHFYNAKVRPWQVATILPAIEAAYQAKQQKQNNLIYIFLTAILVFAMILTVMVLVQRIQNENLDRAQQQLQAANATLTSNNESLLQANRKLSQLNGDIAEANAVKEEYIGLFLGVYSDYIDKMQSYQRRIHKLATHDKLSELKRELNNSKLIDEELHNFYEMFDNAFLRLYPNFVSEFNSLLEEDGRIELKKDERLNTELRIFALIRLGITDSSKIAALLRYAVNTIYNYRAKVKNKARVSREEFEEKIKKIGSFKA